MVVFFLYFGVIYGLVKFVLDKLYKVLWSLCYYVVKYCDYNVVGCEIKFREYLVCVIYLFFNYLDFFILF